MELTPKLETKVFKHPEPRVLLRRESENLIVSFDARVFRHYYLFVNSPDNEYPTLFRVDRPKDKKDADWFNKHVTVSSETVDELVEKGDVPPDINYAKIDRLNFWERINLKDSEKVSNVLISINLPGVEEDGIQFRWKGFDHNFETRDYRIVGEKPIKVVSQTARRGQKGIPLEGKTIQSSGDSEQVPQVNSRLSETEAQIDDGDVWSKIIGQEEAVAKAQQVVSAILHPKEYHEVGANPPRELLLYGPPGTGKTLLAKVMCEASGAELVSIPCGQIDKPLAGKAEDHLMSFFKKAYSFTQSGKPVVLFLDELNTLAKDRSGYIQTWETNLVTILLQQLQKIQEEYPTIAVVATTNLIQNVDSAVLRSGRFTLKEEMGYPRTHEEVLRLLDYAVGAIRARASSESNIQQRLFEPKIIENLKRRENEGLGLVGNASQADIIEGVNRIVAEKKRLEIEEGRKWQPVLAVEIYEGISSITRIREKNL